MYFALISSSAGKSLMPNLLYADFIPFMGTQLNRALKGLRPFEYDDLSGRLSKHGSLKRLHGKLRLGPL
jgi:hypothetical protein